jgi:hypothetical protein
MMDVRCFSDSDPTEALRWLDQYWIADVSSHALGFNMILSYRGFGAVYSQSLNLREEA